MSLIHDQLIQSLLEDTWDLYKTYEETEPAEILADNVRAFEGGHQYREAAISAFVARQIASARNKEIRELSHFSHPTTIQWYDRLKGLWKDFMAARVQESQAGPSSSVDDNLSTRADPTDSQSTKSFSTDESTLETRPVETPDSSWECESNYSDEGTRIDEAFEAYVDMDSDSDDAADETAIALELNASSDWYQDPGANVVANCGRRRVGWGVFTGPDSTHNPSGIEEMLRVIENGIVITEGETVYL